MIVLRFTPYTRYIIIHWLHETYMRRSPAQMGCGPRGGYSARSVHTVSTCMHGLRQAPARPIRRRGCDQVRVPIVRHATCQSPMARAERAERAKKGTESQRARQARQARQAAFSSKPSFHHHLHFFSLSSTESVSRSIFPLPLRLPSKAS